jgi:hypothetical protein
MFRPAVVKKAYHVLAAVQTGRSFEAFEDSRWIEAFKTCRWVNETADGIALTTAGRDALHDLARQVRRASLA